jgi:hypothetical protein
LTLDLPLYEFLDHGDGVKSAVDINILQRIGFENEGYAFLLGYNEDDV